MPAVDLRRLSGIIVLSEGVQQVGHLAVAQRGAGANMSVDIAAGRCYIADDHANGAGYYMGEFTAAENTVIAAADPTNPRIDRVVYRVRDLFYGDAANDSGAFVVPGTPTVGATLANTTGAGAVPGSCLLLGNVLVPAGAASIVTANIDTSGVSNNSPLVRPLFALGGSYTPTLYRATTLVDINTTVAESNLVSQAIPAMTDPPSRMMRVTLVGDYLNNSGGASNVTFRVKFGATSLWASNTFSVPTNAARRMFRLVFEIGQLNANSSQFLGGFLLLGATQAPATGLGTLGDVPLSANPLGSAGATAVDMSVAQTLNVTVQHGTSAATISCRAFYSLIEII